MASRSCIKCGGLGQFSSLETTNAWFCKACYTDGINQKFRSSLTKTKLFKSANDIPILVVSTPGPRLDALLDLISSAKHSKRRLLLKPEVVVVETNPANTENYRTETKADGIVFHYVHLSMVFDNVVQLSEDTDADEHVRDLRSFFLLLPRNAAIRDEFIRLLMDLLCFRLAEATRHQIVLTAENSEQLAQKTISTMCFGRAASLLHVSNVLDQRHPSVRIVRPLRPITNDEVNFLTNQTCSATYGTSVASGFLASVTGSGFPATVSTVLSVASKVRAAVKEDLPQPETGSRHCWLCMMPPAPEEELCETCLNLLSQVPFRDRQDVLSYLNHPEIVAE